MKKNERIARNEKKPMLPNFKVLGHWLTCQVSPMTQNGENWDLLELRLITNFLLGFITDDVFMHLGQVGSGQVNQ